jgi:hypothetical protein
MEQVSQHSLVIKYIATRTKNSIETVMQHHTLIRN